MSGAALDRPSAEAATGAAALLEARRESLRVLLRPSSVAVIGASAKEGNIGRRVVENLVAAQSDRLLAVVGATPGSVCGVPSVTSLSELGFVPEVVVVAVSTANVVGVVREAARLGTRGAVIFAGGFAEAGAAGGRLQSELKQIADAHAMAIIGPNCQGAVNFLQRLALYIDPVAPYEPGRTALIAQSGSVATALANNHRGLRFSHIVSSGNEACTDAADLIEYFLEVPEVTVVCAFLEAIRRPERFFPVCLAAHQAGKAVVVCMTGRTEAAQRSAAAHSGALSSPDRLIDAMFRRHRVIRAASLSELLETAKAIDSGARPGGSRVAALSGSGGQIGLLLDAAGDTELSFPDFSQPTVTRMNGLLAREGKAENPVDYWGAPNLAEGLPEMMRSLLEDENTDVLLGVGDFSAHPTGRGARAERLLDAWERLGAPPTGRFFLIDVVGGTPAPELIERSSRANVVVLSGLSDGLRAIEHLASFAAPAARVGPGGSGPRSSAIEGILARAIPGTNSGALPLELLAATGIPSVATRVVRTLADLALARERLGFPLVAKTADPAIAHKAASGGVILGINSEDELTRAFATLHGVGDGSVLLQTQIDGQLELLLGLHHAPGLGTFILAGLGGLLTELMDDVQVRAVGLGEGEAEEMLRGLRVYGHESVLSSSLPGVVRAISCLDRLGLQMGAGWFQSLDVNPLLVSARGCVAVDALLITDPAAHPRAGMSKQESGSDADRPTE